MLAIVQRLRVESGVDLVTNRDVRVTTRRDEEMKVRMQMDEGRRGRGRGMEEEVNRREREGERARERGSPTPRLQLPNPWMDGFTLFGSSFTGTFFFSQ